MKLSMVDGSPVTAGPAPLLIGGLLMLSVWGCQGRTTPDSADAPAPSADGGHVHTHELPESYAAAVAELKQEFTEIREHYATSPQQADEPMHHAFHLLEHLPELAQKEELSQQQMAEMQTAAGQLMEALGQLHQGMHGSEAGGETIEYETVAESIDQALQTLEQVAP